MRFYTFYRYIIRETGLLFIGTIAILLAVIMSFRLARLLAQAVSGHINLSAIWHLIGLQTVTVFTLLIPITLILAGVITISRFYQNNEIGVLFAAGISRRHLRRPLFILAIFIATITLLLTLFVLPIINRQSDIVRSTAKQQASIALLTPNSFRSLDDGSILYAGDRQNGVFRNFFFTQESHSKPVQHSAIFSDKAKFYTQNGKRFLGLNSGVRVEWETADDLPKMSYATFSSAIIHLADNESLASQRVRNIPTFDINYSPKQQAELQKRINPAISILVFCFAIPLFATQQSRKKQRLKILPAFIAFFLYANLLDFVVTNIGKGKLPIWPGSLWIHALAALCIGFGWWQQRGKS